MVFYLIQNVCDHGVDLGLADAEGSVTSLPFEIGIVREVETDPGVGGSFEFLHPVGQRDRKSAANDRGQSAAPVKCGVNLQFTKQRGTRCHLVQASRR